MLKHIGLQKHPNLVEFIEDFEHNLRPCLVFELLHMNLLEFTGRYDTCRANLHAVRPIAQQVRVTMEQILDLNFTKDLLVKHAKTFCSFSSCLLLWTSSAVLVWHMLTSNQTTSCLSMEKP